MMDKNEYYVACEEAGAIKLETNSPDYNVTKVQFGQDLYVTHVTVLGNQIVLSCAANGLSLYDLIFINFTELLKKFLQSNIINIAK